MTSKAIQEKIQALEVKVARLEAQLATADVRPWWEQIAGSFENDPVYKKISDLGKKYRQSTKPKTKKVK